MRNAPPSRCPRIAALAALFLAACREPEVPTPPPPPPPPSFEVAVRVLDEAEVTPAAAEATARDAGDVDGDNDAEKVGDKPKGKVGGKGKAGAEAPPEKAPPPPPLYTRDTDWTADAKKEGALETKRVRAATSERASGTVDPALIQRAVADHPDLFGPCLKTADASVEVEATIAPSGKIVEARCTRSMPDEPMLRDCVAEAFKRLTVGRVSGDSPARVRLALALKRSDRG